MQSSVWNRSVNAINMTSRRVMMTRVAHDNATHGRSFLMLMNGFDDDAQTVYVPGVHGNPRSIRDQAPTDFGIPKAIRNP